MRARNADVHIFVSYAHRDPPLFYQMLKSLLYYRGVGVKVWSDENVLPGSDPDQQIKAALAEMDIFVPMISPFFEASTYIHKVEIPIAKARTKKGEVIVAPVVVSYPGGSNCDWLLRLERLPHKEKSWADMRKESRAVDGEYDDALQPLRDGIGVLVEKVRHRRGIDPAGPLATHKGRDDFENYPCIDGPNQG